MLDRDSDGGVFDIDDPDMVIVDLDMSLELKCFVREVLEDRSWWISFFVVFFVLGRVKDVIGPLLVFFVVLVCVGFYFVGEGLVDVVAGRKDVAVCGLFG